MRKKVSAGYVAATVRIKKEPGCVNLPAKAHATDAAFDLTLAEDIEISPGSTSSASLGFSMELPEGWHAKICLRSGIGLKHNVFIPNAPGIIDADYRGVVRLILSNNDPLSTAAFVRGTRIAQMLIEPTHSVALEEVQGAEELSATARGIGGFGSTGEK